MTDATIHGALLRRIEDLERALAWYASETHYLPRPDAYGDWTSDVLDDDGERARRALAREQATDEPA